MEHAVEDAMPWERVIPPIWWKAANLHVVADRTLPNGTRQHMVDGHVEPGLVINNAQVVGENDATGDLFSETLSHLSRVE